MKSTLMIRGLVTILAIGMAACAATPTAQEDSSAAADSALNEANTSCGAARYNAALVHYKKAVEGSKRRLAHPETACDDDVLDQTITGISREASIAVTTCGSFKQVIATSIWAKPLRTALDGNAALAALDGRLELTNASGKITMNGAARALEDGMTLWGPAPGAYGNMSKIRFGAGRKGVLSTLDVEAQPVWTDRAMSYELGDVTAAGVAITITDSAGAKKVYRLAPGGTGEGDSVHNLRLVPVAPADATFTAMPSECEA